MHADMNPFVFGGKSVTYLMTGSILLTVLVSPPDPCVFPTLRWIRPGSTNLTLQICFSPLPGLWQLTFQNQLKVLTQQKRALSKRPPFPKKTPLGEHSFSESWATQKQSQPCSWDCKWKSDTWPLLAKDWPKTSSGQLFLVKTERNLQGLWFSSPRKPKQELLNTPHDICQCSLNKLPSKTLLLKSQTLNITKTHSLAELRELKFTPVALLKMQHRTVNIIRSVPPCRLPFL